MRLARLAASGTPLSPSAIFLTLMDRIIIHADMDAFYAAVETLDNPSLRGKPVIVGGDSPRSVVSAASYEARAYGVHSAMPVIQAKKLCPGGIFLPVRMHRYQEISQKIMEIFHRFTPLVEPLSLDEAFLDVTESRRLLGDGRAMAMKIKETVRLATGLTCSVGVASSKLLAKICSDLHKPDGLTVVAPGEERQLLSGLPIGRLWGVGAKTRDKLRLLGVQTVGDLARLPEELLTAAFGAKHGRNLYLMARGEDHRPVVAGREPKSIGGETTFERDLIEVAALKRELLGLSVQVANRLRQKGLAGCTVTLKVKYHDFRLVTRSLTLARPTCDQREIFRAGETLLEKTDAGRVRVRLVGVSVSSLAPASSVQLDLFSGRERARQRGLHLALDAITERFGKNAVTPARLLGKEDGTKGDDGGG